MKIVYSGTRVPGLQKTADLKVLNPVHFLGVEKDAKEVYVNGDYRNVTQAYKQAGIEVQPVSKLLAKLAPAKKEG